MEAPTTWQWRTWRGRLSTGEDHAMPLSPGPATSAACGAPLSPAPPAPAPVSAEQSAPRIVWEDGGGNAPWLRLVATDWADGVAPTYAVQAAHGSSWWAEGDGTLWVPATGEEWMAMFCALAAALDERTPRRGEAGP